MIMARTLEPFDDDHYIPAYGYPCVVDSLTLMFSLPSFGDVSTKDHSCFPFYPDGRPCLGINEVSLRYTELVRTVELSGPTNFGPVIRGTDS
jgi:E3 ubiquitin-protein ligase RGLG